MGVDAEAFGEAGTPSHFMDAIHVASDGKGAVLFEAGGQARIGLELRIELRVGSGNVGGGVGAPQLHDQPSCMPRRTAG